MSAVNDRTTITDDHRIDVQIACPFCGADSIVKMRLASFEAWNAGALIQNAAPDLTADQRELLISGTCGACWKAMEECLSSDDE